ncbi:unnamed protein product [Peronospora farinosa]|uniref:NADH:flavin oxidoreductase/NADH oxidase N-terminal domain-containing protein n=1 Tax=Peronospora farinosa TaxID=134698 RepID=A0AAV0THE6_9STRA|nr:unnamed protein product [Peronospora farinosa]CAI5720823.1 unnamed protein product [Peronospora farinosa]
MTSKLPQLFSPLTLGGKNPVQLHHRVVMAPLTRLRTGEDGVPKNLVSEYYAQRSTAGGLIIAEATNISPTARGYFGAPGIFSAPQIEGWKKVTRAVHDKGGKIFVQLWHTGRVGHPLNLPNEVLPVSSSAIGLDDVNSFAVTREGRRKYGTPRALETHKIPGIVADYKRAAENAIIAGFYGVEIHGANGYLLEQFLCDGVNKRTDNQVGIRLSPFGITFGCTDSNPAPTYGYVLKKLNSLDLAYVHIVEPRGFHSTNSKVPTDYTTSFCHALYHGVLMTSSGFKREEDIKVIKNGGADCVAYGRLFISNPDLVQRLKINAPLNPWNRDTFYITNGPLSLGYTDCPTLEIEHFDVTGNN